MSVSINEHVVGWDPAFDPNGFCRQYDHFNAAPGWIVNFPIHRFSDVFSPAQTYLFADYGRTTIEDVWINNLRAANYTRVYGKSAPKYGHCADLPNCPACAGNAKCLSDSKLWASRLSDMRIYRHNHGENIGYVDGHTKWNKSDRIYSGNHAWDGLPVSEGAEVKEY
ncbi:MAG TPA: hypothetical protein VKT32_13955 [Chthonomonadaceae bacterium]|nr:hypothetical protein [Chthonomonadaceae bacterium]